MLIHTTKASMRAARRALAISHPAATVGFVPTMGALHEGHLSLVQQALQETDHVIVSIYVNPTQFGPNEDFGKYPRTLERDQALLQDTGKIHSLFCPTESLYDETSSTHTSIQPRPAVLNSKEGQRRPGHFSGVATVVTKLLNLVQPTHLYVGQKDAVQCSLLRQLMMDLDIPTQLQIVPTVRDPTSGLALSSRNAYLSPTQKEAAAVLYRGLQAGQAWLLQQLQDKSSFPIRAQEAVEQVVQDVLATEPLVTEIEYIALDDAVSLEPMIELDLSRSKQLLLSLAVRMDQVRLIDNVLINWEPTSC